MGRDFSLGRLLGRPAHILLVRLDGRSATVKVGAIVKIRLVPRQRSLDDVMVLVPRREPVVPRQVIGERVDSCIMRLLCYIL